jgi:hypothetical protein
LFQLVEMQIIPSGQSVANLSYIRLKMSELDRAATTEALGKQVSQGDVTT